VSVLARYRLDGRVAVVSGAGRGIGAAVAKALGEAGGKVVCAARTQKQIDATAQSIVDAGGEAIAVRTDVTEEGALQALVDATLQKWGRIDVLVNVAGGHFPSAALRQTEAGMNKAFDFNVTTAFALTKLCAPHMKQSGYGSVINISSAMSHLVDSGFVAYGTVKAALNHMTRLLAHEWAPHIRCNALAVGAVETDALKPLLRGNLKQQMEAMTPMGRLGQPEDIAGLALYLAAPVSDWVTGQIWAINGGTTASNWPMKIPSGL